MNILKYLEDAALKYPNKIAISDGKTCFTYSELVAKSKVVGKKLSIYGKKNKPICVMIDRSSVDLVYFCGILYSGNYYVPIDPGMPLEKKEAIVSDCCPIAICGNASDLVDKIDVDVIDYELLSDTAYDFIYEDVVDETPLYMVYTSGSTGKPKGVLKSHGAIRSFVEAYCNTFDFSSDEIIGNQTPFFFDASAKDIYLSIKLGATIEIIPIEKFAMPTELIEYLNEKRINFISWVPTALAIVAQLKTLNYILPQYLKKVFFVGEVMPVKYLNYWREKLHQVQFVNLYGQSEIAGVSCYYEVKDEFASDATLPMGKPLCNCQMILVDKDEIVTEKNRVGEIYIVSKALANEYFNDFEKTNSSFMYKNFGSGEVRCFKTGDMAVLDENGNYVFAARSDYQIKHLGHRIELGEIETIAGALEEIVRCACIYSQEKQSIILFAEVTNDSITSRDIKRILREKLSSYMVPEKVKIISKIPINENGKIHRQKLKELT